MLWLRMLFNLNCLFTKGANSTPLFNIFQSDGLCKCFSCSIRYSLNIEILNLYGGSCTIYFHLFKSCQVISSTTKTLSFFPPIHNASKNVVWTLLFKLAVLPVLFSLRKGAMISQRKDISQKITFCVLKTF